MAGLRWIASYPKSGSTWMRAFLTNLADDGERPADINALEPAQIASGRGWLDDVLGFPTADLTADELDRLRPAVYDWSAEAGIPGQHKVHDAWLVNEDGCPLLGDPAGQRAVYLVRNPLDLAASFANHRGSSIDGAIEAMGDPRCALANGPNRLHRQVRQRLSTWSGHVLSWVDAPRLACLAVRYEDLLGAPAETFATVARFLDLPADTARLDKAIRFSAFAQLQQQESESGFRERPHPAERFFRRGGAGQWIDELGANQVDRIVADHGSVMRRFGYLDERDRPT